MRVRALFIMQANGSCKVALELIVTGKWFRDALRLCIPLYCFVVVCRASLPEWSFEFALEDSGVDGEGTARRGQMIPQH